MDAKRHCNLVRSYEITGYTKTSYSRSSALISAENVEINNALVPLLLVSIFSVTGIPERVVMLFAYVRPPFMDVGRYNNSTSEYVAIAFRDTSITIMQEISNLYTLQNN